MDIPTIILFFILLLRFIIESFFICAFYFRYQFFILTFVNNIFPFNQYVRSSYRNYRNSYNSKTQYKSLSGICCLDKFICLYNYIFRSKFSYTGFYF